ncbi:hypothetical protein ALMP_44150 [Streptomyces sp. A012304]|nr:hypothetical protein ALMP_44150 [Streptomyces sp. A012304]
MARIGAPPSPALRKLLDAEHDDSPVIEVSVTRTRHLIDGAEHDPAGFLTSADAWAARHLPDYASPVTAALARALSLPSPGRTTEAGKARR